MLPSFDSLHTHFSFPPFLFKIEKSLTIIRLCIILKSLTTQLTTALVFYFIVHGFLTECKSLRPPQLADLPLSPIH